MQLGDHEPLKRSRSSKGQQQVGRSPGAADAREDGSQKRGRRAGPRQPGLRASWPRSRLGLHSGRNVSRPFSFILSRVREPPWNEGPFDVTSPLLIPLAPKMHGSHTHSSLTHTLPSKVYASRNDSYVSVYRELSRVDSYFRGPVLCSQALKLFTGK